MQILLILFLHSCIHTFIQVSNIPCYCLDLSSDASSFVFVGANRTIQLWNCTNNLLLPIEEEAAEFDQEKEMEEMIISETITTKDDGSNSANTLIISSFPAAQSVKGSERLLEAIE